VLQGTTDRISIADGDGVAGDPTVDIAATYVGQASITTLGTVGTGVWQGTPVGIAYGGSGQVTANLALNAFLPSQPGNAGRALVTDGANTSWVAPTGGTVTSVAVSGANGIGVSGSPITSSGTIALSLGAITPTSVAATGTVTGSNLSGTNTGDQTITLTGDVTGSGTGSFATTLATVNANVGSFGSSTSIPSFTVNGKGLITAASGNAVVAPAGTLTGTTLAANVVSSSLTSVGTIGTGTWQGTAVAAAFGGTGQTSYAVGDLLYASGTTALSKLADVATGNALISGGVATAPSWGKIGLTTHVTGTLPVANGGTGITSFGTGVATWLGTPSSANLRAALTDETGTGAAVFADTPTLVTPVIGAATGTSVNLSSTATASAFIPTGSTVPANGMYLSAANTLDFATNTANRLRINATGDVGVNCTPVATVPLRVQAAGLNDAGLEVQRTGSAEISILSYNRSSAAYTDTKVVTNEFSVSTGGSNERLRINSVGQVAAQTVGRGLSVKEGSNCKQGTATLVAGTVVVNNTSVTASSRIFLTSQADGGTPGFLRVSARTAATSFTITSSNAADTSTVAYEIFEPS
jgi:hypothetical protein